MMSKRGIIAAVALAAGVAGCTCKVDPADMQRVDAAVSRAEAAANKAAAAAQSASQAASQADAAAQKCANVGTKFHK